MSDSANRLYISSSIVLITSLIIILIIIFDRIFVYANQNDEDINNIVIVKIDKYYKLPQELVKLKVENLLSKISKSYKTYDKINYKNHKCIFHESYYELCQYLDFPLLNITDKEIFEVLYKDLKRNLKTSESDKKIVEIITLLELIIENINTNKILNLNKTYKLVKFMKENSRFYKEKEKEGGKEGEKEGEKEFNKFKNDVIYGDETGAERYKCKSLEIPKTTKKLYESTQNLEESSEYIIPKNKVQIELKRPYDIEELRAERLKKKLLTTEINCKRSLRDDYEFLDSYS